ncbi:hypothetical protein [Paenarthrobacter sp. NPDC090522]|uniref:hypothetical protein n=1 Tax=Paenarthrobacter sp. NPDC090522 TaxID=3364383 RepID=UPI003804A78A
MTNKPRVKKDSFWGDLANALLLSPVHRKPLKSSGETQQGTEPTASTTNVAASAVVDDGSRHENAGKPMPEQVQESLETQETAPPNAQPGVQVSNELSPRQGAGHLVHTMGAYRDQRPFVFPGTVDPNLGLWDKYQILMNIRIPRELMSGDVWQSHNFGPWKGTYFYPSSTVSDLRPFTPFLAGSLRSETTPYQLGIRELQSLGLEAFEVAVLSDLFQDRSVRDIERDYHVRPQSVHRLLSDLFEKHSVGDVGELAGLLWSELGERARNNADSRSEPKHHTIYTLKNPSDRLTERLRESIARHTADAQDDVLHQSFMSSRQNIWLDGAGSDLDLNILRRSGLTEVDSRLILVIYDKPRGGRGYTTLELNNSEVAQHLDELRKAFRASNDAELLVNISYAISKLRQTDWTHKTRASTPDVQEHPSSTFFGPRFDD